MFNILVCSYIPVASCYLFVNLFFSSGHKNVNVGSGSGRILDELAFRICYSGFAEEIFTDPSPLFYFFLFGWFTCTNLRSTFMRCQKFYLPLFFSILLTNWSFLLFRVAPARLLRCPPQRLESTATPRFTWSPSTFLQVKREFAAFWDLYGYILVAGSGFGSRCFIYNAILIVLKFHSKWKRSKINNRPFYSFKIAIIRILSHLFVQRNAFGETKYIHL